MNHPVFLRGIAPLLLLLSLGAAPGAASAQRSEGGSDAQARELYLRGDRLYNEGRYEEAVTAFQESYRISRRPLLLFNLANAYERLGRYEEALDALRRYAPEAPVQEEDQIRARIENLSRRAEEVAAEQSTPSHAPTEPPDPAPVDDAAPPAETSETRVTTGAGGEVATSSGGGGDAALLGAGGAVLGLGVALALGGTVFGVLALDARSRVEEECGDGGGVRVCQEAARGARGEDAAYALLADLGLFIGGAAAVAGLVMLIVGATAGDSSEAAASGPRPVVAVSSNGAGVGLVAPF